MKICFLTPDMSLGGSSTLIYDLINNWPSNDDIYLIVFFDQIDDRYKNHFKRKVNIVFLGKKKTIDFKFLLRLKKVIRDISPDIVSTHLTSIFYFSLINSCRRIKVFHTIHSEPSLDLPRIYRFFLKHKIIKGRIQLIGCCKYIALKAQDIYKVKCHTITNGIETTNAVDKKDNALNFLFVGRLTSIKNVPLLIDAFNKTIESDANLIICGFGEDMQVIEKMVQLSPKRERIKIVGKTNDVKTFYEMSHVLCLPSQREGMPITILEAINYGLAIIASNVGGNNEFVMPNFNGFILNEISSKDMSKKMNTYISNNDVLIAHQKNSLALKKEISIVQTAQHYYEMFIGDNHE